MSKLIIKSMLLFNKQLSYGHVALPPFVLLTAASAINGAWGNKYNIALKRHFALTHLEFVRSCLLLSVAWTFGSLVASLPVQWYHPCNNYYALTMQSCRYTSKYWSVMNTSWSVNVTDDRPLYSTLRSDY